MGNGSDKFDEMVSVANRSLQRKLERCESKHAEKCKTEPDPIGSGDAGKIRFGEELKEAVYTPSCEVRSVYLCGGEACPAWKSSEKYSPYGECLAGIEGIEDCSKNGYQVETLDVVANKSLCPAGAAWAGKTMEQAIEWAQFMSAQCERQQAELEELRQYKHEHERLKIELNRILHPDGGGPEKPSFCDLVLYVEHELTKTQRVKSCDTELEVEFENIEDSVNYIVELRCGECNEVLQRTKVMTGKEIRCAWGRLRITASLVAGKCENGCRSTLSDCNLNTNMKVRKVKESFGS